VITTRLSRRGIIFRRPLVPTSGALATATAVARRHAVAIVEL